MTQLLAADQDAEAAVLSLLLFTPGAIERLPTNLASSDFFAPRYQRLMDAIKLCIQEHGIVDIALMRLPEDLDAEVNQLVKMPSPSIGLMGRYVERIVETAASRRLVHLLADTSQAINAGDYSPRQLIAEMVDEAERLYPTDDDVEGYGYFDDWAMTALTARPKSWVIPGMIRRASRVMIVGGEGSGKSTLGRQLGVCASAGWHPFKGTMFEPQKVLLVDLENDPTTAVDDDGVIDPASPLGLLNSVTRAVPDWDRTMLRVWSRQDGIDLRATLDVDRLERILGQFRPDLVVFGPLYKAYRKRERDDDEILGAQLQTTLDRLRVKYDCAWLFEHHAPHGNGARDFRPFGTSLWRRWPDIGISMTPELDDDGNPTKVRTLNRFRGDRYPVKLPAKVAYGTTWPWMAIK